MCFPSTVELVRVEKGREPRSQTVISFFADVPADPMEQERANALTFVLETVLRDVLREDLGQTYTVSVGITLIRGEGEEHALVVNKALAFMVYREEGTEASGTLHRTGLIDPTLDWSMEMKPYAIRA